MSQSEPEPLSFDVAVAIQPVAAADGNASDRPRAGGLRDRIKADADALVVKGDAAVKAATEALASQIGVTAQRIAQAIEAQMTAAPPGKLGVDAVEVSFGVTLAAGVQAVFTAQAESSAQVTVVLTRQSENPFR
jgi:hypothetical protein